MANAQKSVVLSFLKFLSEVQPQKSEDERESLDVAIQCLQQSFELDISGDNSAISIPFALTSVFEAGLRALTEKYSLADPDFQKFVSVLQQKKYFDGVTEGTKAHEERLAKALEKYQASRSQSAAKPAEPAGLTDAQKAQKAEELKSQGNDKMSGKEYEAAVQLYTQAIQLNPNNAIYYGNRAAARTFLKEYQGAVEDCERAVTIDPKYVKAYSRMGTAYSLAGRLQEAVDYGFRKALALDPTNADLKANLAQAEAKLRSESSATGTGRAAAPGAGGFDLGGLLNNPALMGMASQFMQQQQGGAQGGAPGGGLADLLNNPALMSMASQMMKDPNALSSLSSMLGGAAGGAAQQQDDEEEETAPTATPAQSSAAVPEGLRKVLEDPRLERFRSNPKFQEVAQAVQTQGPMAALSYLSDPEVSAMVSEMVQVFMSGPQ